MHSRVIKAVLGGAMCRQGGEGFECRRVDAGSSREGERGLQDRLDLHRAATLVVLEDRGLVLRRELVRRARRHGALGHVHAVGGRHGRALGREPRIELADGWIGLCGADGLPMVWMCLFDLYARSNDRTAFEELALRFVVQFERSAPAWDEMAGASSPDTEPANSRVKPKSLLRGELSDPQAPVLAALVEASKRKGGVPPRFDLDIADLDGASDVCGLLLAGSLSSLRRKGAVISIRGLDATTRRLSAMLQVGDATRKGLWYLVLELLQWSAQHQMFEDRAVDFAVTFGISPPSIEPLTPVQRSALAVRTAEVAITDEALLNDRIVWVGELKGPADNCLRTLSLEAVITNPVLIDMRRVLRVDFVCGSAIANGITRLMAQAIDVRVLSATPIIQTLLQMTGTPAGLFAKA